ncbi:hypothetical protein ACA910_008373 [Epithemia clementina (nom. ined.)]
MQSSASHRSAPLFVGTPFEADLYSDDDGDDNGKATENPYNPINNPQLLLDKPLAVSNTTRLLLGLNKYSHDTSLCAADLQTGQVLYAQAKERIGSRRKHDAGNVATLVDTCLEALNLDLSNIDCLVVNNHHWRVLPMEQNLAHLEWEAGLYMNGGMEDGYTEPENLLPDVPTKLELSHHLAHAFSVAAQAPFDHGMIVVMDGMGETYRTMKQGVKHDPWHYICDFNLPTNPNDAKDNDNKQSPSIQLVPSNLDDLACHDSMFDWREAESVYTFTKTQPDHGNDQGIVDVVPVFKRFTKEHSPPVLYNHGFENMDSLGALYSRVSSHIFGDWNACGKVMGLAPWAASQTTWTPIQTTRSKQPVQSPTYQDPIVSGSLYRDNDLFINRTLVQGLPLCARNDPDLFQLDDEDKDDEGMTPKRRKPYDFDRPDRVEDYTDAPAGGSSSAASNVNTGASSPPTPLSPTKVALEAMALAHRMQVDLETVALDFIRHFRKETGSTNICFAGGVALNSVLNGRLALELQQQRGQQQQQLFIPPYPGDDGIAVGCCAYGLFGRRPPTSLPQPTTTDSSAQQSTTESQQFPLLWQKPLSPYLGGWYSQAEIQDALEQAAPWIDVELVRNEEERHARMVEELASGGVIAWYHSRSEMGPRALGHRSILADPRKHGLVRFINQYVKQRETFRPFAPSVLAEQALEWFEGIGDDENSNVSPYMSLTSQVKKHMQHKIPAVTHIDGSSRLQTVTKDDEPAYHALISKFWKRTGVPMVLNTSFNTLPREPIVETPIQAIRSFLYTKGNLEMLVMEDYIIRRKQADLRKLLGDDATSSSKSTEGRPAGEPARPQRAGSVYFQARFSLPQDGPVDEDDEDDTNGPTTWVQMPDRILHIPDHDNKHQSNPESSPSWYELLDELEGEILTACDGTLTLNEMLVRYAAIPDKTNPSKTRSKNDEGVDEETNQIVQNVIHRLVRLYDETFVYW